MSAAALPAARANALGGRPLGAEVIAHLNAQIASARTLLAIVLEQGAAIRGRDVHNVVRLAGILRGEMTRRQILETQRTQLLARSAEQLTIPVQQVTLTALCTLMDPEDARQASSLSAELRGLLQELKREHTGNRALMRVELSFLDHLMRTLSLDGTPGYDPRGSATSGQRQPSRGALHVLDLRA